MKKIMVVGLIISHLLVGAAGVGLGIYLLPILIAPTAPSNDQIHEISQHAEFTGVFSRDLQDSDAFHWGEGTVYVADDTISLMGSLAPGPDYRLYLSPEFVETEERFLQLKDTMVQISEVNTFENFAIAIPSTVDPTQFNTVIIWCERFGEFITAAQYQ